MNSVGLLDEQAGVLRWHGAVIATWHKRASIATLWCCLALGGGTRPGFLSDVIAQALALILLVWSLWLMFEGPQTALRRRCLLVVVAIAAIPTLQLIPLPLSVWRLLPGRGFEEQTLRLVDSVPAWLPITVAPDLTMLSLLSLLPPAAILLALGVMDAEGRRAMMLAFLVFAGASVLLGLLQFSQGQRSPLRFFAYTNPEDAVGFFANRNHFAALLNCGIAVACAWLGISMRALSEEGGLRDRRAVLTIAMGILILAFLAGVAMSRSRAGVAVAFVTLGGGLLMILQQRSTPVRLRSIVGGVIVFAVAGLVFANQALLRVLQRFGEDPLQNVRKQFTQITLEAAQAFLPFGAGIGTFARVYPVYETPQAVLLDAYVNRAHNDLVEILLEAGLLVVPVLLWLMFLGVRRGLGSWRRQSARSLEFAVVRAASLAAMLLFLHSIFDYPLRTTAMMCVAALLLVWLLLPPSDIGTANAMPKAPARMRSSSNKPETVAQPRARVPWRSDAEWPDAWRPPGARADDA